MAIYNFSTKNCGEISIKKLSEYILETLKLIHVFFHNDGILQMRMAVVQKLLWV